MVDGKSGDQGLKSLENLYQAQKEHFKSGKTRSIEFRKQQLRRLKNAIKKYESEFMEALQKDFKKPPFETYATEIGFLYEEINVSLKGMRSWAKKRRAKTPITFKPSSSFVIPEPKGVCLIIGPWNYPIQLNLSPLVAAISAGNTAILKLPEETPNTSALIQKLVEENFDPAFVSVVLGDGAVVVPQLMNNFRFDHVFFTGSTRVGRLIAKMAAEKLSPFTLELGGKSPAIIDASANLKKAALRLTFGKFVNAGQSCVAPDYVLVHSSVKQDFLLEMKKAIENAFGEDPITSDDLASIINSNRWNALTSYLGDGEVVIGGKTDENLLRIEPTVIDGINVDSPIMKKEIFGPILPVLEYDTVEDAVEIIERNPNPLALYVFTTKNSVSDCYFKNIAFGGGVVNDTLIHLANPHLPFGGVAESGSGAYHGEYGFEEFSHLKACMKTVNWFDIKQRYAPYTKSGMRLLKLLMR